MNKWSLTSEDRLKTCHPLLQDLFNAVLQVMDCSVICGHRGHGAQEQAFIAGKSMLQWPRSKHNKRPSLAADVVPYPMQYSSVPDLIHFAGIVKGIAFMKNVPIKWGGDWEHFKDYAHYELAEVKDGPDRT